MHKHVYSFWSYKFDHIAAWWENKNNLTTTVGWKERPVIWERPQYVSELHSGVRDNHQAAAKCFIKELTSVPMDEYLSKRKWFYFPLTWLPSVVASSLAAVLPFFSWEQVICASCWLVQAVFGGKDCVVSLLKVNLYMKIILSDGHHWEPWPPKGLLATPASQATRVTYRRFCAFFPSLLWAERLKASSAKEPGHQIKAELCHSVPMGPEDVGVGLVVVSHLSVAWKSHLKGREQALGRRFYCQFSLMWTVDEPSAMMT